MKHIILLILTVFLSISSFATIPKDYPDFTLIVKFHPSFLAYSIVTISKHNDKKELSIIEIGGGEYLTLGTSKEWEQYFILILKN